MPFAWAQPDPHSLHGGGSGGSGSGGPGPFAETATNTTLPSTSTHPPIDTSTTTATGAVNTTGGTGGTGGGGDPQGAIPRERVNVGGTSHPISLSNAPPLLSFPDSPWCGSAGTFPHSHPCLS